MKEVDDKKAAFQMSSGRLMIRKPPPAVDMSNCLLYPLYDVRCSQQNIFSEKPCWVLGVGFVFVFELNAESRPCFDATDEWGLRDLFSTLFRRT